MTNRTSTEYKTYLAEDELPKAWLNIRAFMDTDHAPILNPATLEPMSVADLEPVFCTELAKQELNATDKFIPIPEEVRDFYRMYRPSPLVHAKFLEEALDTPAKIYYKFEGNNTSGSHKLNSAIAQAYYAKEQGLKCLTTETGAGQWGTALSMATGFFGLDLHVFMVKCSALQKPFRKAVMETYNARVTASPSNETNVGRSILEKDPDNTGSLGTAISEAVEEAVSTEGCRYVLGSVLNQVLLHQSIIGLETKAALEKIGVKPDVLIGCAGGGTWVVSWRRSWRTSSKARMRRTSSPLSQQAAQRLRAASSLTISAMWARSPRSRRCTRSAPASFPARTMLAVCAITV